MAPFVSLIVPVRNDASALRGLLAQVTVSEDLEIIVSVATPEDHDTAKVRNTHPEVIWVESAAGRGQQLNAGAARATGEWLWFVHADSRLPAGWHRAFQELATGLSSCPATQAVSRSEPSRRRRGPRPLVGGAFRFALDSPAWQARLIEQLVAWRVRWFNLPYGDQGIFVRRVVFEQLGGFAPIPLMEDVEFVHRLKRAGPLRHLTLSLTTSARRWERDGWFRRSAGNLLTLGLYRLGVPPQRLARRYYSKNGHADQETC